jgi:hypothetical protein
MHVTYHLLLSDPRTGEELARNVLSAKGMDTPRQCPRCGLIRRELDRHCEQCGYDFWGAAVRRPEEEAPPPVDGGIVGRIRRWLRGD